MPTTNWNITTIDGADFLVIDVAAFRIPLDWDPSSNMFIAVAAPVGGLGAFPALVKGDKGDPPIFATPVSTVLEPGDPTPDAYTLIQVAPNIWEPHVTLRKGQKGDQGDTVIALTDFGTSAPNKALVVNPANTAFEYQTQRVGNRFSPATINNTALGTPLKTLCSVAIPAQDFDWRPEVSGQCLIDGSASNVRVDLIARLDAGGGGTPETSGNIVGRGFGVPSSVPLLHVLSSGPPANASSTYDKVAAGVNAVVYLRAERIAGTGTFTTSSDTTYFNVWVRPLQP